MQSFVDGARYGRSYAFGYWSQYSLICRQHLAICCLVGIADRQRRVTGQTCACAHEQRCYPRGRPFAPRPSTTHLLFLEPMTGLIRRKGINAGACPLAHRVNPIRTRLTAALRDDCCFFAAVSHFAATRFIKRGASALASPSEPAGR